MVSPKRLENGFNGYQVPDVPRASRSARGRVPLRKRGESNHIQAFEILAKVAGTFLLKDDNTIPTNNADKNDLDCILGINLRSKQEDEGWLSKEEACELESSNEDTVACVPMLQGNCYHRDYTSNKIFSVQESISLNIGHIAKGCEFSDKLCLSETPGRIVGESSCHGYCSEGKGHLDALQLKEVDGLQNARRLNEKKICINDNREDIVKLNQKPAQVTSSDGNKNGMDTFAYERLQQLYPFKKRKFFKELSPLPDEEYQYGGFSTSVNKFNGENPGSVGVVEASSFAVQKICHKSNDCNVKLSIKSFRVPELFIEIPETATIGSLKRTVMEAVSSILRDEIHVGILLQGKKVRDDSKTLVQTGIAQDDRKNRLGFMLEPRHTRAYPPSYIRTSLLSTGSRKQYSRQSASLTVQPDSSSASKDHRPIKSESAEGDCNLVPTSAGYSADKTMSKRHALVAVPSINMEALAVFPYTRKSGNPEFVQRRIRRPFSVSEVEALVLAVEKLGTGRWRDVKVCAFDKVKHRTYVDLKDKWKTLVHTARISPQQRRGEPVPQQLLDRVLAAHAHWSQQSKATNKGTLKCYLTEELLP